MSDAVTKMTAKYIWENRDKGWVKNAMFVQAAMREICILWADDIRTELTSLEDFKVQSIEEGRRFLVTVSHDEWGSHQLTFGCESPWDIGKTFFGVRNTKGNTGKESMNKLKQNFELARCDRGSQIQGYGAWPAYAYTHTVFDTSDMVKAIAEELRRLTCKLDQVLRETRPREQDDDS